MRYLVFPVLGITAVLVVVALAGRSAEGTTDPTGEYPVQMNVLNDPGGLAPSIGMPANITLAVSPSGPHGEPGIFGPAPFVKVNGLLIKEPFFGLSWTIYMTGIGTVAGSPGVEVQLTGTIDGGVLTGIYTMGTQGELPGGAAIEYRVKPKEATATPRSTPTPTTCPQGSGIAGQACPGPSPAPTRTPTVTGTPPTPTRTGTPATPTNTPMPTRTPEETFQSDCDIRIQVSPNGPIMGEDDGIDIDCDVDRLRGPRGGSGAGGMDDALVFTFEPEPVSRADINPAVRDLFGSTYASLVVRVEDCAEVLLSDPELACFLEFESTNLASSLFGGRQPAGFGTILRTESRVVLSADGVEFPPGGTHWKSGPISVPLVSVGGAGGPVTTIADVAMDVVLIGDANCNGAVNSIDAAVVLQAVAGLALFPECEVAADANANGTLNSIDASLILQVTAGLLPSLPP